MRQKTKKNPKILKLCLVAGARPNFMKIAPLIRAIKKHNNTKKDNQYGINFLLVHTGQHYDYDMSSVFFKELGIPRPHIFLNIGSGNHGEQTGRIMIAFEKVLMNKRPDIVAVVGDVNSTIACTLVASKLYIPVAHVEAGLRSFDHSMPEEINRLLTDQISDYLFTHSPEADQNLKKEGISVKKIFPVGNIMIDNLFFNLPKAKKSDIFRRLGLILDHSKTKLKDFSLLTLHRPSNVDNKKALIKILDALNVVSKEIPVLFPVHPRTGKMISAFKLDKKYNLDFSKMKNPVKVSHSINVLNPLGYLDFLALMSRAKIVLTDSGGIQEETTVLGVPCLTLRDTTERPITLHQGTNVLVHNNTEKIIRETRKILKRGIVKSKCPEMWDGKTAERIINTLTKTG